MGQFAVVPTGQVLINGLDWPGALWVLSLFVACAAPLAYYLRGRPQVHAGPHQSLAAAVRQAVRHPSFHFLFWSYFVCGFHTAFITLHLPAYVTDGGLTAAGPPRCADRPVQRAGFVLCRQAGRQVQQALLAVVYGMRAFGILLLLWLPLSSWCCTSSPPGWDCSGWARCR